MLNIVISFHCSMMQRNWLGKKLIDLFGPDTAYIDGGSGLQGIVEPTSGRKGYEAWINKSLRAVPRSPQDPKYKANDKTTHLRQGLITGYIADHTPKLADGTVRRPAKGEPFRVAVVGYSEGCQGVAVFLKSPDKGYIDTAVAIDGIHWGSETEWLNPNTNKKERCPDGSLCMRTVSAPWLIFAGLAARGVHPDNKTLPPGTRCMVLTASDTPPPPCCRQSNWALQYILNHGFAGTIGPWQASPDGIFGLTHNINYQTFTDKKGHTYRGMSYPQTTVDRYFRAGNFYEYFYNNIDTQNSGHWDHTYQNDVVLPLMLEKIVIPRWNASTGGTLVGV